MKTITKFSGILIVTVLALFLLVSSPASGQTIPLKPCLEHFTSSTCPPCASFGPVFRRTLAEFDGRYTIIRYQMYWPGSGDPYYFAESKKRRDYYMITGVPGLARNGEKQLPYAQSFSKEIMQGLLAQLTGVQIGLSASVTTNEIVTVTVTITPEIAYAAGLVTQIVVMEGVTTENATTNGEKAFDHVAMGFMPDASGTVLPALVPGQPVTLTYTLDMKTTHRETSNDLIVAAFIQDNGTKQVIQSNNAPVAHPFTDYQVFMNVIDNDYNIVPGGKVFIPRYGEIEFGANGLVTYKGVFPGNLNFDMSAPGYDGTKGTITVVGSDVSQDVMLDKPDIFYFEDFGWNIIPEGWLAETTNGFMLYGTGSEAGSLVFYKPNAGEDESYLIMPPVNLTQSGIFSFRAGKQSGSPSMKVGIATLEPKPGAAGTAEMTITGFAELFSATVTRFDDFGIFGFPLPETIGNKRLAFKFAGAAGSWCELDQVAILEDVPGVKVQFIVTDQDDLPLKQTQVTLSGKTVVNNAYGYATFRDTDPGNYAYTVTYKDEVIDSGILTVDEEMVKEIKYSTSGMEILKPETYAAIYPNPVKDLFTVNGIQNGTVTILDLNGRQMMQKQVRGGESVSTKGLAKGAYLVKVESDNRATYHKIVVTE